MAEKQPSSPTQSRPKPVQTHSFPRMDTATSPSRTRASTLQEKAIPQIPEARRIATSPQMVGKKLAGDVFENDIEEEQAASGTGTPGPELNLPSTFDELPIEIKSLTERFLDSLSAKVHPTPLSAENLSELFQDFYERAASSIGTHIASLSSRIGRDRSPAPSTSSRSSVKGRARAGSGSSNLSGGEMLTASEVADRRRARRLLELKRLALEEAVERAVCEKVYDRIYKHRSTDDDARDEKLRSRTAALALVGIGLKELHVDSPTNEEVRKSTEEKEEEIHHSLADAREALQRMDDEHYPLGKLQHLTAAHKSIVETLSHLFPSSSSADEILPTLIYTLITSPPEGVNVVSNLSFMQRFRASSKVDGEAAYCMVNLEAAISFLETVDLSSLRADEPPEGPTKATSEHSTPASESSTSLLSRPDTAQALKPSVSAISATSNDTSSSPTDATKPLPSPITDGRKAMHQRRISQLMQYQADRLEAGRDNLLSAADKVYDSINGTLENSFQFVFGRFKDQTSGDTALPKTLEDARKLVNSPRMDEEDDSLSVSGRSSPGLDDPLTAEGKPDKKMLELLGGKPQLRDRSVDSTRSVGSGKRVLFANEQAAKDKSKEDTSASASATNLFNTINNINPLNRFGVPSFPRFGRAGSVTSTPKDQPSPGIEKPSRLGDIVESPASAKKDTAGALGISHRDLPGLERTPSRDATTDGEEMNARETLAELRKLKPPKKRFLEVQNAGELKIVEVDELLLEYRRLAKAIGEAIAQ